MKISINEPCHENWDKMTPNQQGAFCLSCQKNVVDFSKKTIPEIKSFFTDLASTEKVCGRFEEKQLEELSFDDFFNRFKNWHFVKKAAVICFFIFGLTLFSCEPKTENHTMGEAVAINVTTKIECVKDTTQVEMLKGAVAFVDTNKKHLTGQPVVMHTQGKKEEHYLKGKVKVRK